ncbi:retrovirus-related pol polyprotein from transposon TNT 1-94 [Tanacetum coccineum]
MNEDKIKKDLEEIETINIELDHRVSKLIAKNEHLKQTYKQLYDSIKPARIRSKEQYDDIINQVNLKSVEISDSNTSLQEKVLVITALKDDLRKLKGKSLVDNAITKHTIDSEMLKIDVEPITPKLLNKRTAHSAYIKHTQEEAAVFRDLVEHVKAIYPLDYSLEYAFRYTKLIQELLTNISKTYPSINNSGVKLVVVTPKNKDKRVRFTEPITSSGNTNTKISSSSNLVSNKPMLSSTGIKPSSKCSEDHTPPGNIKKDKIQQTPSSTLKNKVEARHRKAKSILKNKNSVVKPKGTATVQHSKLNANSELKCVKCKDCMLSDNHDLCVLDFINNVNARVKSKSVKKSSKRKVWKPTGKVFTNIGYIWRSTGRPNYSLVFGLRLLQAILTRRIALSSIKFVNKFLGTVKFGNDHMAKILGYGDYQIENVTISRVYYVEGLGHNLFFIRKFCDSNLEVAFRQHICFIRNLEGVDLLTGSQGNNLYTLSLRDMMASSPICLLLKASKTKSWLLKKKPHKPKYEDTNQEKLYLLQMDLCGPMHVTSVNGKKYILVIVDDYSRFTWVKCFRLKDEAPDFIIKFLKMIQLLQNPAASIGSPSSTTVDQEAPSPSNSQTTLKTQSPIIPNDVEEDNHDLDVAHMNNDPFFGIPILENHSEASSSSDVIPTIVHTAAPYSEHVTKWTKDHPLDNIIGELERPTYKDALTQSCWIEAMPEELNEFQRLELELVPRLDKNRLVARGYRQEEGIDFDESFALVARLDAIRIFLAYAAHMNMICLPNNVKVSILKRHSVRRINVSQPDGFLIISDGTEAVGDLHLLRDGLEEGEWSPTASVPSPTHVSRSITPTPANLLPPRKRFRGSYSSEDSGEEHMEVDTANAEALADVGISEGVVAHTRDGVGMRVEIADC